MSVIIYHNPRCSKSQETLALIEEKGIQPNIELYLQKQYSVAELQQLANKLNITDIRQMMRVKDELYQSLNLANSALTNADLLTAISEHSALLERPIVVNGDKAKIGRPPESVLDIL
ncbi:arsenate reductase (glutaredoxin) [Rodentibacter caecimuris]|uniref:Arsenate reductase n=1 Tax=Rodentibacter caecimuris TaxID=1796644 RepID=A0AAJ3K5U7_9PAST|nr:MULTISPECIES: arsenate reductase (glutaredoxin) [Pasteurellaceae]AOF53642.1 Arsenate reductase [Pasteurellaceae bacterium NI1060]MCQ9124307.1 arsenate reductase (glutaredoxin) [Rodentibacter heylii]MCR1837616.1 arsenate reductase (glutaredoxin) [Pasteurella caecimuris]MCU0108002.1 arsenate reductase (glutaredoxin) [Pasteurella caecimuris]OOF73321.1 arsenate reductase (glutaredoxin) [Rodentibacter heylii]